MTRRAKATLKPGRAYVYFAFSAVLTALPFTIAEAQVQIDALRYCATLEDDGERLQCFDRAMGFDSSPQSRATEAPSPQPAPAAEPVAERAAGAPPEPVAARPASPAPQAPAPAVTQSVAARDLRGDGSNAPPEELRTFNVTVVNIIENPPRPVMFETDDGRYWIQTSRSLQNYPDLPFSATLEERGFGSLWLVPTGGGRSVRVSPSN